MGFGDCHAWSQQIPAFSARYRTIAYDHRGVGRSEKPSAGYSIPQFAADAGAYLYEKFGPEAASAFGPLVSFTHAYFAQHLSELVRALGQPPAEPMPLHAYLGHVRAIEEHDTTAVLGQIAAPTLVLLGDQEWLNPLAEAERLVRGIRGARLQILPGGGHGFIWEIAQAFNDAVLAFLATVR